MLAYDFYVIYNVFHVRNRVHSQCIYHTWVADRSV